MEALMNALKMPEIVVSSSPTEAKPKKASFKKQVSSEETDVKKWMITLVQAVPKVSSGLAELLKSQVKLQAQVRLGSMCLEDYYKQLAEITKKFKVLESEFTNLINVCNNVRCTLSSGAEDVDGVVVRDMKQYKKKFDGVRADLNEMVSKMNQYRMAQLQTMEMLLYRPDDDYKAPVIE